MTTTDKARMCDYHDCANHATTREPESGDRYRMRFCKDHWETLDALKHNATEGFENHEDIERLERFWKLARGMIA